MPDTATVTRPMPDFVPRLCASNVHITGVLGTGSYATVYAATIQLVEATGGSRQLECALKVVHNHIDSLHRGLFLAEGKVLCQISHPHIIKCYGILELDASSSEGLNPDAGNLALVLELSTDGTLLDYLQSVLTRTSRTSGGAAAPSALSLASSLQWVLQLASALEYLHGSHPQIIHRDIKLENVLLFKMPAEEAHGPDRPGSGPQGDNAAAEQAAAQPSCFIIKLADFGLHQCIEDDRPVYLRRKQSIASALPADLSLGPLDNRSASAVARTAAVSSSDLFFTLDENGGLRSVGSFLTPAAIRPPPSRSPASSPARSQTPSQPFTAGPTGTRRQASSHLTASPASPLAHSSNHSPFRHVPSHLALSAALQTRLSSTSLGALLTTAPEGVTGDEALLITGGDEGSSQGRARLMRSVSYKAPARLNAVAGKLRIISRQHSVTSSELGTAELSSDEHHDDSKHQDAEVNSAAAVVVAARSTVAAAPHQGGEPEAGQVPSSTAGSPRVARQSPPLQLFLPSAADLRSTACECGSVKQAASDMHLPAGLPLTPRSHRVSGHDTRRKSLHGRSRHGGGGGGVPDAPVANRLSSVTHLLESSTHHNRLAQFQAVFTLTGETGSNLYMAPEVFRRQPYNSATDVFALAMLAWQLVARRTLTSCMADQQLTQTHEFAMEVSSGYRPPRPRYCPESVWQLVRSCWDEDPVARPSARQVVAELRRITASLPVHTGTPHRRSGQYEATEPKAEPEQRHRCCYLS